MDTLDKFLNSLWGLYNEDWLSSKDAYCEG